MKSNKDKLKKDPKSDKKASKKDIPEKKEHKKEVPENKPGAGKKIGTDPKKKELSIASTTSIRPASRRSDSKNPYPKAKLPKFIHLIERRKIFFNLKKRFMQWKILMLLKNSMVKERTSKTIVTQKRLNIHRIKRVKGKGKGKGVEAKKEKEESKASGASSTEIGKVDIKMKEKYLHLL